MRNNLSNTATHATVSDFAPPPPTLLQQRRQFWTTHIALPLLLTLLLSVWTEYTNLDVRISQQLTAILGGHFYDSWFLERIMHKGVRQFGHLLAYALLLATLASFLLPRLKAARLPLVFLIAAIATGSSLVAEMKHITNVYCPFDLSIFGGTQPLHSPFDIGNWNVADGGMCWPGGHSSYGFAMWGFYFVAREYRRRLAIPMLIAIAVYGNVIGTVRVIQGAHFLSHQWWTAALCWFVTVLFYLLLLRRDLLPRWSTANTQRDLQASTPSSLFRT